MNVLMYYECLTGGVLATQSYPKKLSWGTVGPSVGALGRLSAAHMAFLGRFWRVFGDLGAIAVDLGSNLVDLGAILVDLGSNFVDLVSEQREARRLARRASKIRTCKRTQEMQALKGKR
jgi:hypothetical protein